MRSLRMRAGICFVLTVSTLYAGASAWNSIRQLMSLQTVGWDVTNVTQAVWNTAHGAPFAMTNLYPLVNRLGTHVEPVILLLAPISWIVGDAPNLAIGLLALQAIVVASGALPVYLLARHTTSSEYGAVTFSLLYLLFPAVGAILSFELHLVTFATGFWLWAIYFFHRQRWLWVVVLSLLASACKENLPLLLITFGGYSALAKRGHRVMGVGLALVGSLWFVIGLFWLQPHFSPTGENIQMRYYAWMGPTLSEKATIFFREPRQVWLRLTYEGRIQRYIRDLLSPWGFTSVLAPLQFLVAMPELMVNLLSDKSHQGEVEDVHYAAAIIPFVTWSAVRGTSWMLKQLRLVLERMGRGTWAKHVAPIVFTVLLGWGAAYHYHRGYSPLSQASSEVQVDSHARRVREITSMVPDSASILVQPNLGPFFSQRREVYSDFRALPKADFLLVDAATLLGIEDLHRQISMYVRTTTEFGLVRAVDGYALLRRGADPLPLPDEFYDFARAPTAEIQYPALVRFGDSLEFLGYDVYLWRDDEPTFDLYFRLLNSSGPQYHIALYLLDDDDNLRGGHAERSTVMVWYPMKSWQANEVVRLRYRIVPWNTRPMQGFGYALGVLSEPDPWNVADRLRPTIVEWDWQRWLPSDGTLLGFARVHKVWGINKGGPPFKLTSLPFGVTGLHVAMAEGASLAGVELPPEAEAGDTLRVTLYWQSGGPTATGYSAFVHLVDDAGHLAAQSDGIPGNGSLPSTLWSCCEIVPDPHSIALAADVPQGVYTLLVGLYDPESGKRLPVSEPRAHTGDNAIVAGRIRIR